jgi:hypothetical protein
MDKDAALARAREIQDAIGQVLLRDWDPIGVRHVPEAHDEYDAYVEGVYRLLASGASPQAIADYLRSVETDQMGLTPARPRDLLPIAERLCLLDVRGTHK